jgi:SAM-dependent methyltransferase
MVEMADSHRKLVAFFMGGGKTATAFLCKEHVEAKRMLYICPPNIVAQTEEKIRLYYQAEKCPTVGIVQANMSDEELADALQSEIVLLPFSMLGAVRRDSRDGEEKDIAQIIGDIPFDMLCVDEAHNAKKEGNLYTDTIFRLARTIPNLYESGYVLELTGDPIPNTPDDIVARLRMLDPEHYPEARGLRQIIRDTSSAVVKNSLMDLLLLIDVPEDWERHVVSDTFELSVPERRAYDLIVANEDLLFTDKYHALNLFLLNPGRFSGELAYGPSTLVYRAIGKIEGFLKEYDTVVVTENNYKYGVTRNRPGQTEETEPSVCDRLRAHFGDTAEICVIDGDTPDHERDAIIARSKEGKKKMIIVAVGKVIREGLDSLSHVHRALVLEPDICKSNLSQLVKRFARNGNEDVEVHVLQASGTIHVAMDAHANQKHELTRRILLFDTPDASELDRLGDPDGSAEAGFVPGSALGEMLYVDRAKILKMLSVLHNAGEEVANDWYDQYGEFMMELLSKRWKYSYEANNSRFVASLIARLEEEKLVPGKSYADIGCGNATLARMLPERPDAKEVHGVDINPYTIDQARRTWDRSSPLRISEGRMSDLRSVFEDGKFGLVNCALALQETKLNVRRTRRPENDERVRSILEMRRILMPGGILVLTLPRFSCTQEEMRKLANVLGANLGFEVLPEYSGQARSKAEGVSFENHTLVCRKAGETNLKDLDLRSLQCSQRASSTISSGEEGRAKNERALERMPDGHIFTEFSLADQRFSYESTESDAQAVAQAEYKASVERARSWLQEELVRRQTLADASKDELTAHGIATLVRIELRRKGYWIFQLEGHTDRTGEYVVSPGE